MLSVSVWNEYGRHSINSILYLIRCFAETYSALPHPTSCFQCLHVTLIGWLTGTMPCQRAALLIGYSQLTIIYNSHSPICNPESRWIGVIVTTYHIYSSLIASDIDDEICAEDPMETQLSTNAEQARPSKIR